jgi:hypothetical protein
MVFVLLVLCCSMVIETIKKHKEFSEAAPQYKAAFEVRARNRQGAPDKMQLQSAAGPAWVHVTGSQLMAAARGAHAMLQEWFG